MDERTTSALAATPTAMNHWFNTLATMQMTMKPGRRYSPKPRSRAFCLKS